MTRKTKGEQEAVEAEQRRGDVQAEQLQNLLIERLDEVITDAFRGQDVEIAMDALLVDQI
jgi:hypothetical protein